MYLVDTNIISAVAPTQSVRDEALADWLDRASPVLRLSAVTSAEIRSGIAKARRQGASRKAALLEDWWLSVEHYYADRILIFDLAIAKVAGGLIDIGRAHGVGFEDVAIAATADVHGLTVLTDNERHFRPLGIAMHNPLKALPPLRPLSAGGPLRAASSAANPASWRRAVSKPWK
jgi:predicted nucleic acid-binding protein